MTSFKKKWWYTASFCSFRDIDVDDISVRCGEWDLTNDVSVSTNDLELVGHQDRPAKSISVHTRYSGTKRLYNDVAVIHLSEPYEMTQNLNAIPLPESPGFMKLCFYVVWFFTEGFFAVNLFYLPFIAVCFSAGCFLQANPKYQHRVRQFLLAFLKQ